MDRDSAADCGGGKNARARYIVPPDHHDRIDFVFARGADLKVDSAAIVGEKSPEADIVSTPWPSNHRAVAATVTF